MFTSSTTTDARCGRSWKRACSPFCGEPAPPTLCGLVPISILGRAPTPNACYGAGRTGARQWDARRRSRLKHRMREMPSVVDAKGTSFYLILNPAAGSAVGWPRTSWVLDDQARWRGREDQEQYSIFSQNTWIRL